MDSSSKCKTTTIVTNPIILRYFIDSVALLVNRYIAHTTKHYQVFIFVVSIIANGALSVFLNNKTAFMGAQLLRFYISIVHLNLVRLLVKDHFVCHVVFLLLP